MPLLRSLVAGTASPVGRVGEGSGAWGLKRASFLVDCSVLPLSPVCMMFQLVSLKLRSSHEVFSNLRSEHSVHLVCYCPAPSDPVAMAIGVRGSV